MSVTRVPIPSISKGSLTKLWGSVAVVALLAAAGAWYGVQALPLSGGAFLSDNADAKGVEVTDSGLQFKTLVPGTGESPTATDVTLIKYEGRLLDGTVFDAQERAPLAVGGSIPGFSEALQKMQRGGSYRLWIPPELGYGDQESGSIPANSVLEFDVELIDFIPEAQLRAMQQQMQEGGGIPGMPPGQ